MSSVYKNEDFWSQSDHCFCIFVMSTWVQDRNRWCKKTFLKAKVHFSSSLLFCNPADLRLQRGFFFPTHWNRFEKKGTILNFQKMIQAHSQRPKEAYYLFAPRRLLSAICTKKKAWQYPQRHPWYATGSSGFAQFTKLLTWYFWTFPLRNTR